jgi:HD-GYP domain-containing protein (c-di-GMP phosphodiesterase class II)
MISKVQQEVSSNASFEELDIQIVEINEITPNNIYIKQGDNYIVIVKAGTFIDNRVYDILLSQKVYIDKNDSDKLVLTCEHLPKYIYQARENESYCLKLLYKMNSEFFEKFFNSENDDFSLKDVEGIVQSIILLVKHNTHFVKDNLNHFKDDNDLAHHSLHVCIYAVNLGYAVGFNDIELEDLGIAGYLQDVGLTKVDQDIVSKHSPLSMKELENIHKHTILSMQIVKHNRIHRPDIINGVKHHHENIDGSGYPDRLRNEQISKFAAILAICDVFDALTSNRPYREKMTSYEALTHMMKDKDMAHKFNNKYIKIFIKLLVT